jgi:hypothetical protein
MGELLTASMFLTGDEERTLVSGGDWEKAPEVRAMALRSTAEVASGKSSASVKVQKRREDERGNVTLTTLPSHSSFPKDGGVLPLLVAHRAHPPRFGRRLDLGLFLLVGPDAVLAGSTLVTLNLIHSIGVPDVPSGLLGQAAPVTGTGTLFGEGLVETGAGD